MGQVLCNMLPILVVAREVPPPKARLGHAARPLRERGSGRKAWTCNWRIRSAMEKDNEREIVRNASILHTI